jgi:hypothetical protein
MTKWDTIQADVADAYIGIEENLEWEKAYYENLAEEDFLDEEDELTLDWEAYE